MKTKILPFIASLTIIFCFAYTGYTAIAGAALTTAQAQKIFNQAVIDDANEGLFWSNCGSIAPLLNKSSATGGWWARGDVLHRSRPGACGLKSQICGWYGSLSPSGYWLERRKNCP